MPEQFPRRFSFLSPDIYLYANDIPGTTETGHFKFHRSAPKIDMRISLLLYFVDVSHQKRAYRTLFLEKMSHEDDEDGFDEELMRELDELNAISAPVSQAKPAKRNGKIR